VRALTVRERFLREERGFTLIEMMVTVVIWIVVLLALYSVFDMSITAFRYGNNKVEAVESARLGLEKMEREIRQAYVLDRSSATPDKIFEVWTSTEIRFGNDLDGFNHPPRKIACPNQAAPPQCEKIGYRVYQPAGSTTYALGRDNTSAGATNAVAEPNLQPVVEQVDYVSPTNTGLRFTYCQRLGGPDTVANDNCLPGFNVATSEANINMVRIQLRVRVDEGNIQDATQTLATDVALRNRGG
jgi:prepilin-type N-terminal cleavage/methylation domain-containing protein